MTTARSPSLQRVWSHSTEDALATSGAPATAAFDLPSPEAMADLELVRSTSRGSQTLYNGGVGLGPSTSRGSMAGGARSRDASSATRPGRLRTGDREHHAIEESDEHNNESDESTLGNATQEKGEVEAGHSDEGVSEEAAFARRMYARFTPRRKKVIVGIVSYQALLSPFASASFLPSIPAVAADLNSNATIINITVAIFILVIGISPLFWAPYAGIYGRKPIYVCSLPIFVLGSMGVALSNNLSVFIVTRMIQGFGSSAVLSVGAGTIGDLYPREERGAAMGAFYSGILLDPSLAPAIGGILTEYVRGTGYGTGWRAMQWLLMAMGIVGWFLGIFGLPETAHRRGIDDILEKRRRVTNAVGGPAATASKDDDARVDVALEKASSGRFFDDFVIVWLNPLSPLKLLARPHILAMSLVSSFVLSSTYSVLVPLAETIRPRYRIHNTAVFGCFYLAQGIGNFVSSRVAGVHADRTLRKWRARRKGEYVPEDRLRAAIEGICYVMPVCVLALGWTIQYGSGPGGLAACVILLFFNGVSIMLVLTPTNTYCVDVMQHRSAEVIATNNCIRYIFSAAASAYVLPLINRIGVGWANTVSAGLLLVAAAIVLLTIRYGERMRSWHHTEDDDDR